MTDNGINNVAIVNKSNGVRNLLRVNIDIPYDLIAKEVEESTGLKNELTQISALYDIYKNGADFNVEPNEDYIPSNLKFKKVSNLINKEARFLFGNMPDIVVNPQSDTTDITEELKDNITNIQNMLGNIFDENMMESILLKAAKDCFIGKRVACLVNFNEQSGVTIQFLRSTQFVYETSDNNPNEVKKFVAFITTKYSQKKVDKRIFKKKYELEYENNEPVVYLTEEVYDGTGMLLETPFERQSILLSQIPVAIIVNDGLSGDTVGVSEVEQLMDSESYYSKLSNGDMDAARKSMNPIRYVNDMDVRSTSNLSSAPGAFWDLQTNQNSDNVSPMVGQLTSSLEYSQSLNTTLKRINANMYDTLEMPDVNLENMSGVITSGKGMKAIYWPLIVRCNEKMKTWGPQLKKIVNIIIEGAIVYPDTVQKYTDIDILDMPYEVAIEVNYPLPADEQEEKNSDMSEVDSQVMSKKSYMMKWRGLTDEEAEEELEQIAKETEMLQNSSGFGGSLDMSESDVEETMAGDNDDTTEEDDIATDEEE